MEYNFRAIEKEWQKRWKETDAYKVPDDFSKPKYYVLDMFPYPSGAGLHVGHPLGYIASDIFARYKRLKGFNVLHPMGYDAFGLPAEQYAIDHGIHPAVSTENNINTFRKQLDNIGFCYDWSREVRTSDAGYYKWTQWIFLQLFKSWYNRTTQKAESIDGLIAIFETEGNISHPVPDSKFQISDLPAGGQGLKSQIFSPSDWASFDEFTQQAILMEYRLAYCGYGEVNWCEALGTVLANDEVINGVSERGGYPVVKKKLRQWYLRITEYADRLQGDLDTLEWSDAMKEMQTNWIGKSSGAEIKFPLASPPAPLLAERGDAKAADSNRLFKTADDSWHILKEYGKENRKNATPAEDLLWQNIRNNKLGIKVRRQHSIQGYIVDFALLEVKLVIEVDGGYHDVQQQKIYDEARTKYLQEFDLKLVRFSNDEVLNDINAVIEKIKAEIQDQKQNSITVAGLPLLSKEKGLGDEATPGLRVYTTRPDTIFGVDFMVLAPEHELVEQITTTDQKAAVEGYVAYVKSRSERERMAEKKISGCFTGAYAVNPLSGKEIPVWISEYVLAGYGTGAIMAVPSGDERDHKFAKFFNIPITNIFGEAYTGEDAIADKNVTLYNSGFITGLKVKEAAEKVIEWLENNGDGERKVNYKMRDAAFSRQRYWGEPFPIVWKDGIAYPLKESELPLELPHVESYGPGPDGEGPLANIPDWYLTPVSSPQEERGAEGAALVPKYKVLTPTQFELARIMRKEYTEAEKALWEVLRNNKAGAKIRRQHPIEAYIVDFVSLQDKLIIEVDGGYHESEEQRQYDEARTKVLKDVGFDVIRFTNEEVLKDPYIIKNRIKEIIERNKSGNAETGTTPLRLRGGDGGGVRETNTMPGYAGSSWYFLRYMDPHNDTTFCDRKVSDYWNQVDLYIGGTEHAVGHLLYSRMWTKALYDLGHIGFYEPFRKLLNQGMIQGSSRFVYRLNGMGIEGDLREFLRSHFAEYQFITTDFDEDKTFDFRGEHNGREFFVEIKTYDGIRNTKEKLQSLYLDRNDSVKIVVSNEEFLWERYKGNAKDWFAKILDAKSDYFTTKRHNINVFISSGEAIKWNEWAYDRMRVDVNFVDGVELDREAFKKWRNGEYANAEFILEDGKYICGVEVEKMSKSKFNTVNPDMLVDKYGADTFRMYEMFLGPVEQSKPWDTKGIEGVHRFLKKLWRLFYDEQKGQVWKDEQPTPEELKVLHRTIKKIEEDTERFSFNTAVSAFMIVVNELTDLKCSKKAVLENILILLTPYAPHVAEELWHQLGNSDSILDAPYPVFEEKYVVESSKSYPVAINGKTRTEINIALDATQQQVEAIILADDIVQKWLEGKQPKKIIYVKNRMINVVM